jgi:hypothetical protein
VRRRAARCDRDSGSRAGDSHADDLGSSGGHFIDLQLVGAIEGDIVELSVNANGAKKLERGQSDKQL